LDKLEDKGHLERGKIKVEFGESRETVEYVISKCATQKDIEQAKHSSKFKLYMNDYRRQSDLLPISSNKPAPNLKEEDLKKMSKLITDKDLCGKAKFGHQHKVPKLEKVPLTDTVGRTGLADHKKFDSATSLSILCSFHDINVSTALMEYLTDPDKINYLVRQLPLRTENIIPSRDYLSSFYNTLDRLCFMGLITQRTHRKTRGNTVDEMVYVHKTLKLKDISTSKPHYSQISADQEYPFTWYKLGKFDDVRDNWLDLQKFSDLTNLNRRGEKPICLEEKASRKEAKMKQFVSMHIKLTTELNRVTDSVPPVWIRLSSCTCTETGKELAKRLLKKNHI